MIGVVVSKNGCRIRLTNERWNHIVKSHRELENMVKRVLKVVSAPDLIIKGRRDELIAASKKNRKYLVVIYKESKPTGFIVTAFVTSKIEQIKKRGVIWQKKRSGKL